MTAFVITTSMNSQEENTEKELIKKSVETFFEGFHNQDSLKMKSMTYGNIKLLSIGKSKDGLYKLDKNDFSDFLKSIVSIPEHIKFKEKLSQYNIQLDEGMAHVWVNYIFYINNEISHCGVNSFQLYKDTDGIWKIIYLADTRKKNCN